MKLTQWILTCALVAACPIISQAQAKPAAPRTVSEIMDHAVSQVEGEFLPAADAMPESKYSFAPTNGDFKGVRTFAQQVRHVAAVNYMIGATILEEKPPIDIGGESGPESIATKADIIKFAKDSFAYLHKALASINEKNETGRSKEPIRRRQGKPPRNRHGRADPSHESLRPNGRIPAHERNYSPSQPRPIDCA